MRKDNIDWKEFAKHLLWRNIVSHKNEDSGYDIMTEDEPNRGIRKGDIANWDICSYVDPFSHKNLTWKELALELDLFTDSLAWDGHDCKVCPNRKNCKAYFKDDPGQERCSEWRYEPSYPIFRIGDTIERNRKSSNEHLDIVKIIDIKEDRYIIENEEIKNDTDSCEFFILIKDQNNWSKIDN